MQEFENIKWTDLKNTLEYIGDTDINHKIRKNIKDQLVNDLCLLKENKDVSSCAKYVPRLNSSLDRKTKFAHALAVEIFPPEQNTSSDGNMTDKERKIRSYIRYQRLLSKLSKAYKTQLNNELATKKLFREARLNEHKNLWCSLKNKPLSDKVVTPTPMPVTIASFKELQPIFDFLKSGKDIISEYNSNLGNYMKFDKCAIFTDGRLDLCKQGIGSKWIDILLDNMKNNSQITDFLSGNNVSNIDGARAIAKFLLEEHKAKIKTWYLAGNCLDAECMKIICDALENDTDIRYLWLKRNPIQPEGIYHIANLLKHNQYITILDLHNTAVLDKGLEYLCEGLHQNKSLNYLYLDANGITPVGIKSLCEYYKNKSIKNEKGITSLSMSMNRLDDEGVILLLESLKNYQYLKRLNIGSNRITFQSAKAIYDNLKDHSNLIMLDLGLYKATADMGELSNRISDDGAKYISKFIAENRSVRLLSIMMNDISSKGIEEISNGIENNDKLLYLYYSQYGLSLSQNIVTKIKNKLLSNLECTNYKLEPRYIKHGRNVRWIDSIYRNKN